MTNGASEFGYRFSTRCARAGVRHGDRGGNKPVQQPIVQSSIFDLGGSADAEAIFSGGRKGYAYSRFGNLQSVQSQLAAEHVPFNPDLRIGAIIETPSAVLTAGHIAHEVDFLSIGTNDLTQYLLASDRGSRVMANYYEPLHPAVMLSLKAVVDAAATEGKQVSVCGEMAGNPAYTELLVGLGIRSLSVAPGELLEAKRVIRTVSTARAHEVVACVLSARTIPGVKECLAARAHEVETPPAAKTCAR